MPDTTLHPLIIDMVRDVATIRANSINEAKANEDHRKATQKALEDLRDDLHGVSEQVTNLGFRMNAAEKQNGERADRSDAKADENTKLSAMIITLLRLLIQNPVAMAVVGFCIVMVIGIVVIALAGAGSGGVVSGIDSIRKATGK